MEKALKITAIVLFALIMGFFVFQAWLGHKVISVIEEKGSEVNGGVYNVQVDDARVNIFGRSIKLTGIRITPDRERAAGAAEQEMLVDLSVDGISASGINLKMLRGKAPFKLRSLEIERPVISADIYKGAKDAGGADSAAAREKKPFQFPTRRLVIHDGVVVIRRHEGEGQSYTEATDINVNIRERKTADATSSGIAGYFDGVATVSGVVMTNPDASVDTIIDTIRVDLAPGRVTMAGVTVTPRYEKEQFVYKSPRHRDWTHLWARDIQLHGLDVRAEGSLVAVSGGADGANPKMHVTADSLYIGSGLVESYKDRNASQPYWVRKLIFESVAQLPFLLTVGKAVIADMDAVYSELPKMGTHAGIINFTNLAGTVTGLSNVPSDEEPFWTLAAHGFIYGTAPLNATFYFPKSEATNRWEVSGSLGQMNLLNLNKTIVPLAKAEIESGTVDRMQFHMTGNRHTASVDMELLYHDLKVDLIKFKENNEIKERRFLSWIANEFVIKDSNPSGGETRRGTGSAERELDRSQFNFLWKTLAQGIKETAGL